MNRVKFYRSEPIDKPEIVGQLLGFVFYTALGLYRTYTEKGLSVYAVVGIVSFFLIEFIWLNLNANWLMVKYSSRKQPFQFYTGLFGLLISYIGVRYLTAYPNFVDILNSHEGEKQPPSIQSFLFLQVINFSLTFIIGTAMRLHKNVMLADRKAHDLEAKVNQASMQMLKYQISPHFLYNTLSYMYSEARSYSNNLAQSILLLSNLMRYTLDHSNEYGDTLLSKEIKYIQDFIELYRLRFGDNFYVDFTIEGVVNSRRIVPLLLITFVENAFKHGTLNDATCPVRVQVVVRKTSLFFSVHNYKQRGMKDKTSGIGLDNTRKRLALAYPDQHSLTINNTADSFQADLIIDYKAQ